MEKLSLSFDDEIQKIMLVFNSEVGRETDTLMRDIAGYIDRQAAYGVSEEQIINNLETQMATETGIFANFNKGIERIFVSSVMTSSRGGFNIATADKRPALDMRQWITVYSGNESTKNCDTCLDRHMDVKSLEEWTQIGTPDNPFFDVHLSYGVPCHCILMPHEISKYADELIEPIQA